MKQRGDQVFHLSQTGRQDQRRRRTAFSLVCSLELKVAAYTPSLSLSLCIVMSATAALSSRQSAACCSASGRSTAKPSTSAPSIPLSSSSSTSHHHRRRLLRGSPRTPSPCVVALAAMQPGEIYMPDPLMDVSAIQAAAGAPGAAAGAGGGGGGRPRRRGPPDLPSLLMDGRIVYLGMPVRIVFGFCCLCCEVELT
jgi:hypothetical protein